MYADSLMMSAHKFSTDHVKMGDQPASIRKALKPLLAPAATTKGFLPETARRLGSTFFTSSLSLTPAGLADFVEDPVTILKEVLENLDVQSKAAVALVFLHGQDGLPSPVQQSAASNIVERLFVSIAEIRRSLEALNGSLPLCLYSIRTNHDGRINIQRLPTHLQH